MGKLEELEEELYGKEEEELTKRMRRRVFFPGTLRRPPTAWIGRSKVIRAVVEGRKNWKFLIIGGALALAALGALFIFLYLGTRGQEVKLTIQGRDSIEAGELLTVPVVFRNKSSSVLKEVELSLTFPEGSLLQKEGTEEVPPPRLVTKFDELRPGEEKSIEFVTRMFGREGEEKKVEATLLYRPESLRARFSAKETKTFVLGHVPLALSWEAPEEITQGQEVEVRLRYSSSARTSFQNLSLRLEYPPGFTFKSGVPQPTFGDAIWSLGTLESGQEGVTVFRGTLLGEEGQVKAFRAGLGVFNQLTKEWRPYTESSQEMRLATAPLSVQAFLAGSRERTIVPGEELDFKLRYKNNTQVTFRNITVRASLEGAIVDMATLSIGDNGVFDSQSRSLVWGPGNVAGLKELRPEEQGELGFRVRTRARPPVRSEQDKNLVLRLHSSIEAAGVPQELAGVKVSFDDTLTFKVRSKILFGGRVLYGSSPISNSGPLPPRVGQKTSYTVAWELRNFTNDLANVEVRAALPPNIKWENVTFPRDSRILFDAAASEVRWTVGALNSGIGVLGPALLGYFQVSLVPAETDIGKPVQLLGESRLTGTDTFTLETIEEKVEPLSTELREEPSTSTKDWTVVR